MLNITTRGSSLLSCNLRNKVWDLLGNSMLILPGFSCISEEDLFLIVLF